MNNFTLTFPTEDGVLLVAISYDLPSPGATFEYWTHDDHDPDALTDALNEWLQAAGDVSVVEYRAHLTDLGYIPAPTTPYEVIQWMAEAIFNDAQNN